MTGQAPIAIPDTPGLDRSVAKPIPITGPSGAGQIAPVGATKTADKLPSLCGTRIGSPRSAVPVPPHALVSPRQPKDHGTRRFAGRDSRPGTIPRQSSAARSGQHRSPVLAEF